MDFAQLKTVHWTVFYHIHYIAVCNVDAIEYPSQSKKHFIAL